MKRSEGYTVKRNNTFLPRLFFLLFIFSLLIFLFIFFFSFVRSRIGSRASFSALEKFWTQQDYAAVYETADTLLDEDPLYNAALIYKGYASFYLSVSQTDTVRSQEYLDEAIVCLRKSIYTASEKTLPQIFYMLGKAYFFKNTLSSYSYYSDLVIKYLNEAQARGYAANDIPEYLGLSYAALDMRGESLVAFTNALLVRESDMLLLAIAEQYYLNGQYDTAMPYLYKLRNTADETVLLKSKILLGKIYIEKGNYADARKEYEFILEKNPKSADAYYGLGVIYEKQGDLVKARAEWRQALRLQVDHPEALRKMTDYK